MTERIHFHLRGKSEEIHTLQQGDEDDDFIEALCAGLSSDLDGAVARTEIVVVKAKWPTCNGCLGGEWSESPGSETRWHEDHGYDPSRAYEHQFPATWQEDSPAPQISRRETY